MGTAAIKNRYFEETLPEGYRKAFVVDPGSGRLGSRLKTAVMLTELVLFAVIYFVYVRPRTGEIAAGFTVLKCVCFIIAYFLYIVMHELTHGVVYKLLTKKKLTVGFKPPTAYCGVMGIYAYRITALASLLAPLTVFSIIFAAAFFVIDDSFVKALVLALLALHLAGCVGDLYNIGLLLFRFRDPDVLREDTGPKQIYFTKN